MNYYSKIDPDSKLQPQMCFMLGTKKTIAVVTQLIQEHFLVYL